MFRNLFAVNSLRINCLALRQIQPGSRLEWDQGKRRDLSPCYLLHELLERQPHAFIMAVAQA